MQTPTEILNAHIMHAEIIARGHGPDPVKDVFVPRFPRHRMDNHVGIRKNISDRGRNLGHYLAGALEGDVAGQPYREVGKVAVTSAAYARPLHAYDPVDLECCIHDPASRSRRRR